uniref:G_PROTEIN_RECEP_F1_2 domain-containing protein n=1 Tax=Rhabditophanes sp. KR3021 TaxID=114890 RepID=A0AC35U4X2_9BILA
MFSVYITVFAACDCFASVSRNFSQMKGWYCKTEVANRIVFYIFIFVISYNIITFKELEAIVCFHPQYQHDVYELCPTALRINEDYTTIYRGYMYALIYAFLPFVLLCMLTFGILFSINQKKAPTCNTVIANTKSINFCTTETGNFQSKNEENDENGSAPIVLIMVVALFLLCNIIPLAANICELMPGLLEESQMHLMGDIGNILVIFNATANFFIYLRFSSAYAKDFKYLMCNSTVISKCQTQSNNKFCLETENV